MRPKKVDAVRPYYQDDAVTLYQGDCLSVLAHLPEGSLDTCLTSPPYWSQRDYGVEGRIGLEESPIAYTDRLVRVFREVRRVLAEEGTVWLNIGDAYNDIGHVPFRSGWQRPKQLALVPYRVALGLQDDGWWVRNVGVWYKSNAMPASVADRLTNRWEPVFLLAKNKEYFFNLDAIRVKPKTDDTQERKRAGRSRGKASGHKELRQWLGSPRHRVNIDGMKTVKVRPDAPDSKEVAVYLREARKKAGLTFDEMAETLGVGGWQVIHYFRLDGSGSRLPPYDMWLKLKALLSLDDRYDEAMKYVEKDNVLRNHPNGKHPGDVFNVPLTPFSGAHYATMPLSLAHMLLSATLPEGGTALDPFSGAGTTGVAATMLGGRYVGIEINQDHLNESVRRLKDTTAEAGTLRRKDELFTITDDDDEPEGRRNGTGGKHKDKEKEDELPLFSWMRPNGDH